MANLKNIRSQIKSVTSIQKVTKAMIKIALQNYNEQIYLSDRLDELGSE